MSLRGPNLACLPTLLTLKFHGHSLIMWSKSTLRSVPSPGLFLSTSLEASKAFHPGLHLSMCISALLHLRFFQKEYKWKRVDFGTRMFWFQNLVLPFPAERAEWPRRSYITSPSSSFLICKTESLPHQGRCKVQVDWCQHTGLFLSPSVGIVGAR